VQVCTSISIGAANNFPDLLFARILFAWPSKGKFSNSIALPTWISIKIDGVHFSPCELRNAFVLISPSRIESFHLPDNTCMQVSPPKR